MSLTLSVGLPPPTKKARTESDAAPCIDTSDPHSFYLDTLPKEVLENVLRHFSRLPKAKDWVPHILLEAIIGLYGVNGELGALMKPRFTTLCISNAFKKAGDKRYEWEERTEEMLYTNDIDIARRFVLAGGGQSLRTIIVGEEMYAEDSESESESGGDSFCDLDCTGDCKACRDGEPSIVDDFLKSCPNVISLIIDDKKGRWTSKFGDKLESLEIVTEKSSKIFDSCRNLRTLNLYAPHADDLRKLGNKLECLSLYCAGDETSDDYSRIGYAMEAIEENCRNLRSISLYTNTGHQADYINSDISSLLASYGDQLDYCFVEDMSEDELTTIASACKNVQFSVRIYDADKIYPTLKVLGSQLDKIDVDFYPDGDEIPDYNDLRKAWNGCDNVRDLEVSACTIEHAKAIMAMPKEHLTKLCISPAYGMEEEELKKLLDIFAEGTVAVEQFVYHAHPFAQQLCEDAMKKFVARNASSMRDFSIHGYDVEMEMDAYLPLLLKCPALESVRGFGECKFDTNMIITLRSRGVACFHNSSHPSYS